MREILLLILFEIFGLTLSPRRIENAEQVSKLALLMLALTLTSFWRRVAPSSLLLSGVAGEYLRRDCSTPSEDLERITSRMPAYSNGCHVCLASGSESRLNPSTEK